MPNEHNVTKITVPSELRIAIEQLPGLAAPIAGSYALLSVLGFDSLFAGGAPQPPIALLQSLLAVIIGAILFTCGSVWDGWLFEPLYRAGSDKKKPGLLLARERRAFGVLPAGKKLENWRSKARAALNNPDELYDEAEYRVRHSPFVLDVQGPLVLSKLARSFVWPGLALAGSLALRGEYILAGLFVGVAFAALVPFLEFRVKHMVRLYRAASRSVVAA